MIEIIFYGRGGMGAVTAGKILADAAILSGNYPEVSAFPSFGTERRGAPVQAFCRISDTPIWTRAHIEKADYAIVLDETVFGTHIISSIKETGALILNTPKCPSEIRETYDFGDSKITIVTADLTQIAFDLKLTTKENQPIVNTSVLGVITKSSVKINLADAQKAIENKFGASSKTALNVKAAQMAAELAEVGEVN
ncbi:Pyruvate/ketoisovalerate oxidoreductases common subunit gamma [Candidatus Lokiarchaeum ossiferum]|uniref:pyruvate synthase n=1 Tax=Candidatus Lokiarchaeum ossiferum TaxID=2951803 RepID=A0ABY6HTW7_9ARCH|nr:Pyruvate/ketoisovalerate oxidoreductases common subunit gamma [Candidatus Lokiarchaeum sp. B-35]